MRKIVVFNMRMMILRIGGILQIQIVNIVHIIIIIQLALHSSASGAIWVYCSRCPINIGS